MEMKRGLDVSVTFKGRSMYYDLYTCGGDAKRVECRRKRGGKRREKGRKRRGNGKERQDSCGCGFWGGLWKL